MEILLAKLNVCSEAVRRLHPAVDLLLTSGAVPRGRVVDAADGAHDKARRVLLAGLFHRGRNGSGDDGNQLVVVRLLSQPNNVPMLFPSKRVYSDDGLSPHMMQQAMPASPARCAA